MTDTARIDPQLAAALKKAADISAELGPPVGGVAGVRNNAARGREYWNEGGPQMARTERKTISGPLRDIPVVVYYPSTKPKLPVFVYFHGGGYRIGNEMANDRQMREIAAAWGGAVISADYAHVPEHAFPAAIDEAATVYRWLAKHGQQWGLDGDRMAIGGSSAGANVALGAAVAVGGTQTGYLKAGVSVVGLLDDDVDTESMRQFDGGTFYPDRNGIIATINDYAKMPGSRQDPRFNIAGGDVSIMPPLYLAAAELDTLKDSTRRMAERLKAAGRPHTLKVYPGMTHTFLGFSRSVERAQEALRDIAAFLSAQLPA
jgi:acetyl esterase